MVPVEEVRVWLFGALLPFWARYGVDRVHGGFLEEVSPDGEATTRADKRVRTMCRQTYAFAHAAELGWREGGELAEHGYRYLAAHAKLGGGAWAKTLTRAGEVLDATPDLYDLAFIILALAWRYRLDSDRKVLSELLQTLDFLDVNMRADEGFLPSLPDPGLRQQNPLMHLTEACLAGFEATGVERFHAQACELIELFRRRLFAVGTLGETFAATWARIPSAPLIPGHHFEWVWILAQARRLGAGNCVAEAEQLLAWAERHGCDRRSGAVMDAVSGEGAPVRSSSRAWPNIERIRGWIGLYELSGRNPAAAVSQSVRLLFDRYCAASTPGAWVDQFDAEGQPMVEIVPASIVYHMMGAFSEVLRVAPRLCA